MVNGNLQRGAFLSADGCYRWLLWRAWAQIDLFSAECKLPIAFIGLNPSTADGEVDDNTIRRLTSFAKLLGAPAFYMLNLFAYRSTEPKVLRGVYRDVAVGDLTDRYLVEFCGRASKVVCCWGNEGAAHRRGREVIDLLFRRIPGLDQLWCFGETTKGEPRHPLYLACDTELVPFAARPEPQRSRA